MMLRNAQSHEPAFIRVLGHACTCAPWVRRQCPACCQHGQSMASMPHKVPFLVGTSPPAASRESTPNHDAALWLEKSCPGRACCFIAHQLLLSGFNLFHCDLIGQSSFINIYDDLCLTRLAKCTRLQAQRSHDPAKSSQAAAVTLQTHGLFDNHRYQLKHWVENSVIPV